MSQDLHRDRHMRAEPPLDRAYQAIGDAGEVIKQLRAERDTARSVIAQLQEAAEAEAELEDESQASVRRLREEREALQARIEEALQRCDKFQRGTNASAGYLANLLRNTLAPEPTDDGPDSYGLRVDDAEARSCRVPHAGGCGPQTCPPADDGSDISESGWPLHGPRSGARERGCDCGPCVGPSRSVAKAEEMLADPEAYFAKARERNLLDGYEPEDDAEDESGCDCGICTHDEYSDMSDAQHRGYVHGYRDGRAAPVANADRLAESLRNELNRNSDLRAEVKELREKLDEARAACRGLAAALERSVADSVPAQPADSSCGLSHPGKCGPKNLDCLRRETPMPADDAGEPGNQALRSPADDGSESSWCNCQGATTWHPKGDETCVSKETATSVHSDAENESPPYKPGDWVRHYYAEECVGEVGGVEPRDGTVGVGWIGANKLQWHHQNHLEPWQPRKYDSVLGETLDGTVTHTGVYTPFYRPPVGHEDCVAVYIGPSKYGWVLRDSLRPAEGGEQ